MSVYFSNSNFGNLFSRLTDFPGNSLQTACFVQSRTVNMKVMSILDTKYSGEDKFYIILTFLNICVFNKSLCHGWTGIHIG